MPDAQGCSQNKKRRDGLPRQDSLGVPSAWRRHVPKGADCLLKLERNTKKRDVMSPLVNSVLLFSFTQVPVGGEDATPDRTHTTSGAKRVPPSRPEHVRWDGCHVGARVPRRRRLPPGPRCRRIPSLSRLYLYPPSIICTPIPTAGTEGHR